MSTKTSFTDMELRMFRMMIGWQSADFAKEEVFGLGSRRWHLITEARNRDVSWLKSDFLLKIQLWEADPRRVRYTVDHVEAYVSDLRKFPTEDGRVEFLISDGLKDRLRESLTHIQRFLLLEAMRSVAT